MHYGKCFLEIKRIKKESIIKNNKNPVIKKVRYADTMSLYAAYQQSWKA